MNATNGPLSGEERAAALEAARWLVDAVVGELSPSSVLLMARLLVLEHPEVREPRVLFATPRADR